MKAQAESLRTAQATLASALAAMDLPPWRDGETVAAVAMGASSHSAEALVAVLAQAGVRGVNLTASDLELARDGFQPADHYIVVSESGRSPEPIRAAEHLTPGRRIAITNDPASPLARAVDFVLPTGGFPDSRVYTSGYTATLLAYELLISKQLSSHRVSIPVDVPSLVSRMMADYAGVTDDAAQLLEKVRSIDFVARGVSMASAAEGALVFREAARVHATAYETHQYLHGPMEALGPDSGVIVFGEGRELSMLDSVLDRNVSVLLVTHSPEHDLMRPRHDNLRVIRLPKDLTGFDRAIVEVVLMQLVAAALTANLGLDINEFVFNQADTKLKLSDD